MSLISCLCCISPYIESYRVLPNDTDYLITISFMPQSCYPLTTSTLVIATFSYQSSLSCGHILHCHFVPIHFYQQSSATNLCFRFLLKPIGCQNNLISTCLCVFTVCSMLSLLIFLEVNFHLITIPVLSTNPIAYP